MNIFAILIFLVILIFILCNKSQENYYDVFGQYIEAPFEENEYDNMDTLSEAYYPYYDPNFCWD